jgi:hypothetical protein
MKVRLRATLLCPDGVFNAGEIVELDDRQARELLAKGDAEPVYDRPDLALPDSAWPETGCTLDEARRRTVDPLDWKAAVEAENALALASGRRLGRTSPSSASLDADDEISRLECAADAAWARLNSRFRGLFIDGRLFSTGAYGGPSETRSLMPCLA